MNFSVNLKEIFVLCDVIGFVMSRVVCFDINLSTPSGIFSPGDVISGSVCIETLENLPVHGKTH